MARKRGSKANSSFPEVYFANITLSQSDKEVLASLAESRVVSWAEIDNLVLEGFKFSLSFDHANHSGIASFSIRVKDSTGTPYTAVLTGRGSTLPHSRLSLLYKHHDVSEGLWPDQVSNLNSDEGDFG